MIKYGNGILLGRATEIPDLDPFTRRYLHQLDSINRSFYNQYHPISLEEYIKEVSIIRESTLSGPLDVTPAMVKTEALDPELAEIGWQGFNFPWCTIYSTKHYQRGIRLLINKYPNDWRPHRIRPVLLFDKEANRKNKHIGRMAMIQSKNLDKIAPEKIWEPGIQRRRHPRTQYQTILWSHQKKIIPATSIFTNLVSNYDLEVHSIASISLQRVNVPKEPILCNFTTLQNITHSVRTPFGYSNTTYGGDTWSVPLNPPPQGLGQGNGAAPDIWAILRTLLLNCLRKLGHGSALKCCISGDTTRLVGYYFVYDSTIFQIYPFPNTHT